MDSPSVAASSSSVNPQKKSNKKVPIEEIFTHLKLSKSVYGSRRTVSLISSFFFTKKKTFLELSTMALFKKSLFAQPMRRVSSKINVL